MTPVRCMRCWPVNSGMAGAISADTGGALTTGAGNAIPAGAPLVRLHAVTKAFPGIIANKAISLALWPGEVHVLLGENGAGKSTLVALLSGMLRPDSGRIEVAGAARQIDSPRRALALGIGTVFQHPMLVPTLTLTENLALGDAWWRPPARRRDVGITPGRRRAGRRADDAGTVPRGNRCNAAVGGATPVSGGSARSVARHHF
ncbi:ATP-binding cassette domain-containing protein [Sodalis endosymbiont of Spalangia cameroni]|uniref:ATP-binding cassette domain-containing protein n=1 Tax=Sodalis praecaptivus TaxID=1239307 RepID=UPI0031F83947